MAELMRLSYTQYNVFGKPGKASTHFVFRLTISFFLTLCLAFFSSVNRTLCHHHPRLNQNICDM